MINIKNPYSNEFIEKYWKWFSEKFKVNDSTLLSEIFRNEIFSWASSFTLKDIILSQVTYLELASIIEPYDSGILKSKFDFISEYKRFSSRNSMKDNSEMNAYKLSTELDIDVCPYCNRNKIETYIDKKGRKRSHIDHFYPKKKYPYLTFALFNMVPSCSDCNSSFKGDHELKISEYIHPYYEGFFDDAKFDLEFKNNINKNDRFISEDNFDIIFKYNKNKKKIRNNNSEFHLVKDTERGIVGVYQDERNEIMRIFQNHQKMQRLYIDYIKNTFGENIERKKNSLKDLYNFEKTPMNEITKTRISKFKNDIIEQYFEDV